MRLENQSAGVNVYSNETYINKSTTIQKGMLSVNNPGNGIMAAFLRSDEVQNDSNWLSIGKQDTVADRVAIGYTHSTDGNTDSNNHGWIYMDGISVTEYYKEKVNVNKKLNAKQYELQSDSTD